MRIARPLRHPWRASTVAAAGLAILALSACGGDGDDGGHASRPAPPASEFPPAGGRPLEDVLTEATGQTVRQISEQGEIVAQPAGTVMRVGANRLGFALFTPDRDPIDGAVAAIYAEAPDNRTRGPFPARFEDLSTDAPFRAETTVDDPDAATSVYVADVDLYRPGKWTFSVLVKEGDGYRASLLPAVARVGRYDDVVPGPGDRAPRISTPTAADVADISEIDTRVPPDSMHDVDLADVLGRRAVVLVFATPALCQSRVCGPVVDVAEQVRSALGDHAAFVHMEIFVDNRIDKGPRPQVRAYHLPSEPWLFVIDRRGIVRTAIEGAFSVDELTAAVGEVSD